jgi:DNA-binding beta-propeller fold protein YncE
VNRNEPSSTHARLALIALAAVLAALLFAATASAAPTKIGEFTANELPGRLAVDESSGNVYVIDEANKEVDEFSPSGTLIRALTAPGDFGFDGGEDDIAVDNSGGADQGNVYVAGEQGAVGLITAFDSSGAELWQLQLPSGSPPPDLCGIAVDPSGNLWTAEYGLGVQERSAADGSEVGAVHTFGLSGQPALCEMAFGSSGDLFMRNWNTPRGLEKSQGPGYATEVSFSSGPVFDVATDTSSNNDVYITLGIFGSPILGGSSIAAFDSTGAEPFAPFGSGTFFGVTVDGSHHLIYVTDAHEKVEVWTIKWPLTVAVTGNGTVSAESGPISGCTNAGGATCEGEYGENEGSVTLTGAADPGWVLAGWIGCKHTGAESCEVAVSEAKEVTAVFLEKGTQGGAGPQGPTGPAGSNGSNGAPGPRGLAGPAAKVTCKVKNGTKVKVTCTVKQGASASSARLRWRLMRAGRAVSHGTSQGDLRLSLGHLRPGHYSLHVQGQKGATSIVVG